MPSPLLVVLLLSALLYLLPAPAKMNGTTDARLRELVRLTFQAAVLLVLYELASGRPVRFW
jgi:hypothetical protein